MMKFLAVLAAITAAATAKAWLFFDLIPVDNSTVLPGDDSGVPDFNDGTYFTFDIEVTPDPGDTWLSGNLWATIDGPAVFFQHPIGTDVPPDPEQVDLYPALAFDSFLTTPVGGPPIFPPQVPPDNEPTAITAYWAWDGPPVEGSSGPITRVTAQWLGGAPATLTLDGECGLASTGGVLAPFSFTVTIPEPSAVILLALGGLLIARRR